METTGLNDVEEVAILDNLVAETAIMEQNMQDFMQNALDNMTSKQDLDVLYVTSIAFLIVLTTAIVSSIISYRNLVKEPQKQKNKGNGQPSSPNGILERAFDQVADPNNYNLFGAMKFPVTATNYMKELYRNRMQPQNQDINRISMNYSSAN